MQLEFEKAFEYLYQKSQDIPKKYLKLYRVLLDILRENSKQKLPIRHNRFKFTEAFLILFSQSEAVINMRMHSHRIYDFIEYLKNMDYISHTSDCYPIKEPLVQINKFHNFLAPEKFYIVDKVQEFKKYILNELWKENLELATYMCMSLIEEMSWNEKALQLAKVEDLFFIDNKKAYQIVQREKLEDGFVFFDTLKIRQGVKLLKLLLTNRSREDKVFDNPDNLQKKAKDKIKDFFGEQVLKNNLRRALLFVDMQSTNGVIMALKYQKIHSVPISIGELNYLYGDKVPQHLIALENNNLVCINKKPEEINEYSDYVDEMPSDTKFDYDQKIAPLFYFNKDRKKYNLLQMKSDEVNQEDLEHVKKQIKNMIEKETDISTGMVLEYIVYLIDRIYIGKKIAEKIKFNTFVNYINLLKKQFFSVFTDFEHIDEAKLYFIVRTYEQKGLAAKSIEKLQYLIRDFFTYNGKHFSKKSIQAKYMPKSLIFYDELDVILNAVEIYFREEAKKRKKRYAKFYKFVTLQFQAYVLLAFYTGLRLNELRTRAHKDICKEPFYIYDSNITENIYTINVDTKGLKDIKNIDSFKSSNAIRRVCFKVANKEHAKLIQDFLKESQNRDSKPRYLFKDFDQKSLKIFTKTIEFSKLTILNNIIKKQVNRYATLHSLRHSCATYWFLERRQARYNDNNILLDFSIVMGHAFPAVTFQSYIHFELLEEIEEYKKDIIR